MDASHFTLTGQRTDSQAGSAGGRRTSLRSGKLDQEPLLRSRAI